MGSILLSWKELLRKGDLSETSSVDIEIIQNLFAYLSFIEMDDRYE